MVRYVLNKLDIRRLQKTHPDDISDALQTENVENDRFIDVPYPNGNEHIFVNILERRGKDWAKLRLYYKDGRVIEGWTWQMEVLPPVKLINTDELFDGRFNT